MTACRSNRSGSATSAAKVRGSVGRKIKAVGYGEVSDSQLARDIAQGSRRFWANRAEKGIFCDGPTFEGQMRGNVQRKARAA